MITPEYLENFEESLQKILIEKCNSAGFIDGNILLVEELDEIWKESAPEYLADAMPLLSDYPTVAMAWAAYFGMAMAAIWDGSWEEYQNRKGIYIAMRDVRGFDNMDEYIIEELLGLTLESDYNQKLEAMLLSLARAAVSHILKEQIEAQTSEAFYIMASTVKIMFKIGISIELKELGYKYEKVVVGS
ncbi:MAG: hypothetical protein R3Y50_02610 [Rikenellaceae bacterium]